MGLRPMEINLWRSHSGDGPTLTPFTVIPQYLGAAVGSWTSTGIPFPSPSFQASIEGYLKEQGISFNLIQA